MKNKKNRPSSTTLTAAVRYLSVASLLTAATTAHAQMLNKRQVTTDTGDRFPDFLVRVNAERDSLKKREIVNEFLERLRNRGRPWIEDTVVYFVYHGKAKRVSVPGDLNKWSPLADTMMRVPRTDLFYVATRAENAARFEYKLLVDTIWVLDPFNQQQAMGGYGPNSEIWMPGYAPPSEIDYRPDIHHGRLDTLVFKSRILKRAHPVFIYTPPDYNKTHRRYPAIYVTDGGEYLTLAQMLNVLDNLIADGRIEPVVGVFIDPRTNVWDAESSKRMYDYTMSDTFVQFLATELRDSLLKKYRLDRPAARTAIMGASLGGLISTYAAYMRPDVFGLSAAQSPAYWWNDEAILRMIAAGPKKPVKFYIDTGTIHDAQIHARKMKQLLEERGYEISYGEYPEGHNWVNWRARIDDILTFFWGRK